MVNIIFVVDTSHYMGEMFDSGMSYLEASISSCSLLLMKFSSPNVSFSLVTFGLY